MSPLANQDPLAQLNDIIAPTAPSWFPPAPIYWFLLLTIISLCVVSYTFFKQHQKQKIVQSSLLTKLDQLQKQQVDFVTLNQLLKVASLHYFPRDKVASLHGEQWFDFLQQYSAFPIFKNKEDFMQRLYGKTQSQSNDDDFANAQKWISALPKQIKKQGQKNV